MINDNLSEGGNVKFRQLKHKSLTKEALKNDKKRKDSIECLKTIVQHRKE